MSCLFYFWNDCNFLLRIDVFISCVLCIAVYTIFSSNYLVYFIYTKHYFLHMITFSHMRFIDYILLPLFSGSLFFLLLLSPLLYYSFVHSFHSEYMLHQWVINSELSSKHVQNVYMFIQGEVSLYSDFSLAEKSHMEDVKKLFGLAYLIESITGVVFLSIFFVFIFQKKFRLIARWLFRGSLISLILLFLIVSVSFIHFEAIFNFFHIIFFPQGNWSFDASSMLISLFPVGFFEAIAIRIFSIGTGISSAVFVFGLLAIIYSKKRHA